jgi:hypothetical protein
VYQHGHQECHLRGNLFQHQPVLLLVFCPMGVALSINRIHQLGRGTFFTLALIAPWGSRIVQPQMMVVYLLMVKSKNGAYWSDGTAIFTAFCLTNLQPFGPIQLLINNVAIMTFITWLTLIVKLSFGTWLLVKRLCPTLIMLGVMLQLSINLLMLTGLEGALHKTKGTQANKGTGHTQTHSFREEQCKKPNMNGKSDRQWPQAQEEPT